MPWGEKALHTFYAKYPEYPTALLRDVFATYYMAGYAHAVQDTVKLPGSFAYEQFGSTVWTSFVIGRVIPPKRSGTHE